MQLVPRDLINLLVLITQLCPLYPAPKFPHCLSFHAPFLLISYPMLSVVNQALWQDTHISKKEVYRTKHFGSIPVEGKGMERRQIRQRQKMSCHTGPAKILANSSMGFQSQQRVLGLKPLYLLSVSPYYELPIE